MSHPLLDVCTRCLRPSDSTPCEECYLEMCKEMPVEEHCFQCPCPRCRERTCKACQEAPSTPSDDLCPGCRRVVEEDFSAFLDYLKLSSLEDEDVPWGECPTCSRPLISCSGGRECESYCLSCDRERA